MEIGIFNSVTSEFKLSKFALLLTKLPVNGIPLDSKRENNHFQNVHSAIKTRKGGTDVHPRKRLGKRSVLR